MDCRYKFRFYTCWQMKKKKKMRLRRRNCLCHVKSANSVIPLNNLKVPIAAN